MATLELERADTLKKIVCEEMYLSILNIADKANLECNKAIEILTDLIHEKKSTTTGEVEKTIFEELDECVKRIKEKTELSYIEVAGMLANAIYEEAIEDGLLKRGQK